jgi:hypothetical protein
MPPIHMPACPVSTTTMASSGTCSESSRQMRSGRIGTASEVIAARYLSCHSAQIFAASAVHGLRLPAVPRSAAAIIRARVTFTSPLTAASSG